MKKLLTFFLITMSAIGISAQEKFEVVVDAIGTDRLIAKVENTNNSGMSTARLSIFSGTAANQSTSEITSFAKSYVSVPGYAGYGSFSNNANGIILRSYSNTGNIRFLTGGISIIGNTRMFINPVGQIGVGTDEPAKKLHIKDGDLYMDTSTGGEIIIKSPNGSCFSLTVTNAGAVNVAATAGGCPTATN